MAHILRLLFACIRPRPVISDSLSFPHEELVHKLLDFFSKQQSPPPADQQQYSARQVTQRLWKMVYLQLLGEIFMA